MTGQIGRVGTAVRHTDRQETIITETRIPISDAGELATLLGPRDGYLNLMRRAVAPVSVQATRDALLLAGEADAVAAVAQVVEELLEVIRGGHGLQRSQVEYAVRSLRDGALDELQSHLTEVVLLNERGTPIRARTPGQRKYVQAIQGHDVAFGVGPAGTGKTYLAMACAVAALKAKSVARIILCRPAVEAGERLGFLPGDLQAKIDPYLRPLYDALYDMVGLEQAQRHVERNVVEVAPLAFMRGRTLNDAYIILDEAQNTTPEQMQMFLTRLGFGSRAIITGDLTQTDLPQNQRSGLFHAVNDLDLGRIAGISVTRLGRQDVVRHELVQRIVEAYEHAGRLPKSTSVEGSEG